MAALAAGLVFGLISRSPPPPTSSAPSGVRRADPSSNSSASRELSAPPSPLTALQRRYNAPLLRGVQRFHSELPGARHMAFDNTGRYGSEWTKCTNLALDLLVTLVAERRALIADGPAREHVRRILAVLAELPTYHGLFPEFLRLDGGIRPEIKDGRLRFSTLDSAWVTLALSLTVAHFGQSAPELAAAAERLLDAQDDASLVRDGLLIGGVATDPHAERVLDTFPFSYGDRNSEARPLVLALIGLGQLPPTVWDHMRYTWTRHDDLPLAQGWHASAFVELTGQLFFDEMTLAPRSLGRSHTSYVQASQRVGRRHGHIIWGYAPACAPPDGYAEYGLDRPDLVTPYAAALLATTNHPEALTNLERVLTALELADQPLPDGLDPRTGRVACHVARLLDQALLFLALNVDTLRALTRESPWSAAAEARLRAMDQTHAAPP